MPCPDPCPLVLGEYRVGKGSCSFRGGGIVFSLRIIIPSCEEIIASGGAFEFTRRWSSETRIGLLMVPLGGSNAFLSIGVDNPGWRQGASDLGILLVSTFSVMRARRAKPFS